VGGNSCESDGPFQTHAGFGVFGQDRLHNPECGGGECDFQWIAKLFGCGERPSCIGARSPLLSGGMVRGSEVDERNIEDRVITGTLSDFEDRFHQPPSL
jgi:hypothetical protein